MLERLADDLEERLQLRAKLMGAALYPAIVTLVSITIVLFLVALRGAAGGGVLRAPSAPPFLTVAMLAVSDAVRHYGWALLIALVLIAAGARLALAPEEFRQNSMPPGCATTAGPPGPGLQRRALCQHPGHAGRAGVPIFPRKPLPKPWATAPCAPTP